MKIKWIVSLIIIAILAFSGYYGFLYYNAIFSPNLLPSDEDKIILIYPETTEEELLSKIQPHLINVQSFYRAKQVLGLTKEDIKMGRYDLSSIQTNRELINTFKSGRQSPVKVVIYNENTVSEVSGKISQYLMLDSIEIEQEIQNSPKLKSAGFSGPNLLALFIPNTYEMYWSISANGLIDRLIKENERFWNKNNRKQKAEKLNLSPAEVYTLASIVDRETLASREKPIVARLYLNRLRKGMLLQADPTVVFANQLFETRRVLYKHLKTDSPYNTYIYAGLPPGPIGIASISGIDAVLNPDDNEYLYMCSKPDNTGLHNFATNLTQHNRNAAAYRRWLDARGIR